MLRRQVDFALSEILGRKNISCYVAFVFFQPWAVFFQPWSVYLQPVLSDYRFRKWEILLLSTVLSYMYYLGFLFLFLFLTVSYFTIYMLEVYLPFVSLVCKFEKETEVSI